MSEFYYVEFEPLKELPSQPEETFEAYGQRMRDFVQSRARQAHALNKRLRLIVRKEYTYDFLLKPPHWADQIVMIEPDGTRIVMKDRHK